MAPVQMDTGNSLVNSTQSLTPLPIVLKRGLLAVCILGFLSLVSSACLLLHLIYRLITTWRQQSHARANQFVILILNLILADIQQSVAFLLNIQWVYHDAILINTNTCWSQGWFVSTGDLASGVFTFAIAIHSFADIVFDFRLGRRNFVYTLIGLWTFVFALAIIGLAMHPSSLYTRAGAWCWVSKDYLQERLWLHYIWVIIAEFGCFLVYALIFVILRKRVREAFYLTSSTQLRAQSAAKLIIAYPIVYVVCTLPLVIARLKTMAGLRVSFLEFCISGAMITSNGWLDVLLYAITRRALIFGPELTNPSVRALDTFTNSNWRADSTYGNTTTIQSTSRRPPFHQRLSSRSVSMLHKPPPEDHLHQRGWSVVKTETIVEVTRSDVDITRPSFRPELVRQMSDSNLKGRLSFVAQPVLTGQLSDKLTSPDVRSSQESEMVLGTDGDVGRMRNPDEEITSFETALSSPRVRRTRDIEKGEVEIESESSSPGRLGEGNLENNEIRIESGPSSARRIEDDDIEKHEMEAGLGTSSPGRIEAGDLEKDEIEIESGPRIHSNKDETRSSSPTKDGDDDIESVEGTTSPAGEKR